MKRPIYTIGLIATVCCVTTACNRTPRNMCCEVVDETYVHKYGVEVPQQDWTARGEHGQVISTLNNGVVVTKSYAGGELDDDTTYTFPHSTTIEKVETYSNGVLVKEVLNTLSGIPTQETVYKDDRSKDMTIWYEKGSPKSVEHYDSSGLLIEGTYYDARHQLDARVVNGEGMRFVRDGYGQLLSKDTIQGGALTTRTTYHPNGTPNEITPYVNGIVEGQRKTYLPAGEPNTVETWENGKQTGITVFYLNGEKYSEVPFTNGIRTGVERRYRDGKEVVQEIAWKDNQKHGLSKNYVGDAEQAQWFYQDKPVSKNKFESMSGTLTQ